MPGQKVKIKFFRKCRLCDMPVKLATPSIIINGRPIHNMCLNALFFGKVLSMVREIKGTPPAKPLLTIKTDKKPTIKKK